MTDADIVKNKEKILNNQIATISAQKKTYLRKILKSINNNEILEKVENGEISLHKGYLKATGNLKPLVLTYKEKKKMGEVLFQMLSELNKKKHSTFIFSSNQKNNLSPFIEYIAELYNNRFISEIYYIKSLVLIKFIKNTAFDETQDNLKEKYDLLKYDETALNEIINDDKKLSVFLNEK